MNIAKESPRFEDGVLCWYSGNTFDLSFTINLTDGEETINLNHNDKIIVVFKESIHYKDVIAIFENTNIIDNTITMIFDKPISDKFKAGDYVFGMKLISDNQEITLIPHNKVKVEVSM